jgi:hypothetical protein
MSANHTPKPENRINQNFSAFREAITDMLSKDVNEDEAVLPFILHWLNKFDIQDHYLPKDIFEEAYRQILLDIQTGDEILNASASMKRKSLKIIRRHAQSGSDKKLGVKYSF